MDLTKLRLLKSGEYTYKVLYEKKNYILMFQEDNIDSRIMVFTDKSFSCTKKSIQFSDTRLKAKRKKKIKAEVESETNQKRYCHIP